MNDSIELKLKENLIEDVVEAIKKESYTDLLIAKNLLDDFKSVNSTVGYKSCNCMGDWCCSPFSHGLILDGKRLIDYKSIQLKDNNLCQI